MTADTQARPDDTTAEPKRKFKFPTGEPRAFRTADLQ